jgi:small subunit ribosomal protein S13
LTSLSRLPCVNSFSTSRVKRPDVRWNCPNTKKIRNFMPRLLGVDIPGNKKIPFALRYIYGIGPTLADRLVKDTGLDPDMRAHELNENQLNKISEAIVQEEILVEGDLRRTLTANLKRLQAIQSYRGIRHRRGLPSRGQRTQCNSRTRKGRRKTVGGMRK